MENTQKESGESNKNYVRIAACVFGAAGLVLLLLLGYQWALYKKPDPFVDDKIRVAGLNEVLNNSVSQERRIARAKELREYWKIWAMKHKQILREMLGSTPDKSDSFWKAYAALPKTLNPEDGLTPEELDDRKTPFIWLPFDSFSRLTRNLTMEGLLKFSDIPIAYSLNPGLKKATLWASGRITETEDKIISVMVGARHGETIQRGEPVEVVQAFKEVR